MYVLNSPTHLSATDFLWMEVIVFRPLITGCKFFNALCRPAALIL